MDSQWNSTKPYIAYGGDNIEIDKHIIQRNV